jgi:hypothetical protein
MEWEWDSRAWMMEERQEEKKLNLMYGKGRFCYKRTFINIALMRRRLNLVKLTGSLWRRQSQQSFNALTPFYFPFSLHVSAPTGHPQVRYAIRYLKDYFLIQRIRCTYAIWCRDVICCTLVLQLVVLIHVIKLNIKIKIIKSAKFDVTSGVQKRTHI